MTIAISVEHLSKSYRLGQIGTGTFAHDLNVWWARMRGKPNPMLRIGESDHGNREGENIWALRDVSFTVEQGEVLGIIGRNGAGKSTLLKILSRVTAPTSGKVKVKGRVASLLEVGTGFHPELTGRENIYLNGAILGMSRREIERKFDEIVDFAEVEKFIDTPVKRYSSGMYVRLAFAVAAHLDPEILVVDEVLAVGDAEFQKKCLGKMGNVAYAGKTVLFVSHQMPAIQTLCSRVLVVHKGEIYKDTSVHDGISVYTKIGIDTDKDQTSWVDLSKHEGRSKDYVSTITSAKIEDLRGNPCNHFFMGEGLRVAFSFNSEKPILGPGFGFGLDSIVGQRILSLNNRILFTQNIPSSVKSGEVICEIANLSLLPGQYFFTLTIVENRHTVIDKIERALSITVEPFDVYQSGVIPASTQGIVFAQGKITYENKQCD